MGGAMMRMMMLVRTRVFGFVVKHVFAMFSCATLLGAGVIILWSLHNSQTQLIFRLAEARNIDMTSALSVMFRDDVKKLLASATNPSPDSLRQLPEALDLSKRFSKILSGSRIAKVKIYSLDGTTLFSTEAKQIGENQGGNAGFLQARSGLVISNLVWRNRINAFDGDRFNVHLLASYVPVVEGGRVVAVFEQYQDISDLVEQIDQSRAEQALEIFAVFSVVWVAFVWVVRRARAIVDVHVARLESVNHRLDERVAERTKELRRSEERFRSLSDMSSDFYWETDRDHRFTLHAASDGDGDGDGDEGASDHHPFVGKFYWEVQGVAADEVACKIQRAALDAYCPFRNVETTQRMPGGRDRCVSVSGDPVFSQDGAFLGYRGVGRDITERRQSEERIRDLAYHDQLTGLPNRTLLNDRLTVALADAARTNRFCAFVLVDLDQFKVLNDTRGHACGDRLLRQVASRLGENTRDGDTVARLGGDEFAIILKALAASSRDDLQQQAQQAVERLLAEIRMPYDLGDTVHHCTASVGIAVSDGRDLSIEDLLKQADLAMYKAKQSGGDGFHFFDDDLERSAVAAAALEADLRVALVERQFTLHLQPQVDFETQEIQAAEALIRWNHPVRGLVQPNEFIGQAEQSGMIVSMGLWVLEEACAILADWKRRPELSRLVLSVNVSARQFQSDDFVAQATDVFRRTGVDPRRLKIELTESVMADHPQKVSFAMSQLKELGVTFSLDDFGTGYSSLSYLSTLPIDQLKIDRSFVSGIGQGARGLLICTATISLARSLNLTVVAEGVETEAEAHLLGDVHRCDLLQGYLFGRPMPRQDFEALCLRSPKGRQRAIRNIA